MKKNLMIALSALVCTAAQAGSMGPVSDFVPSTVPFLGGEASYSWNGIKNSTFNANVAHMDKNGWGGRLSAGLIRSYSESVSFLGEIGGGYYGSAKYNLSAVGMTGKNTVDGYDVLVGAQYQPNQFGIYGEMGFMVQNLRFSNTKVSQLQLPGGIFNGTNFVEGVSTQVLPELKVGAFYDLHNNLDLTVAYSYVFGSTTKSSATAASTVTPPNVTVNGSNNMQNPSLQSILFGLRYRFV